jgi:hypothetical protein
MPTTKTAPRAKSLLEDLDALVDEGIGAMSPTESKKFRRDRKKIMQSVARRGFDLFEVKSTSWRVSDTAPARDPLFRSSLADMAMLAMDSEGDKVRRY